MRVRVFGIVFLFALILGLCPQRVQADTLPEGFVEVVEVIPDVFLDVRYYGENNFVGKRVDGYLAPKVILTREAARALAGVQKELAPFDLSIKLFDGYRPQRAVDNFVRWAGDLADTKTKARFYPGVEKKHLFRDGYIAEKSGHSRGSTVDLTIVDRDTGEELNMGSPFDFFGPESWPQNADMSLDVRSNRALLRCVMVRNGFKPYEAEWWHFTLSNEPYPDTYFDFPVQ